ncbi:dihydrofolate reductase [Proteus mirabilis]|uniref:dihydrofolate reductase n=1 Tax=Proteus mirabilis TaxID=584 RepID=UPI0034D6F391
MNNGRRINIDNGWSINITETFVSLVNPVGDTVSVVNADQFNSGYPTMNGLLSSSGVEVEQGVSVPEGLIALAVMLDIAVRHQAGVSVNEQSTEETLSVISMLWAFIESISDNTLDNWPVSFNYSLSSGYITPIRINIDDKFDDNTDVSFNGFVTIDGYDEVLDIVIDVYDTSNALGDTIDGLLTNFDNDSIAESDEPLHSLDDTDTANLKPIVTIKAPSGVSVSTYSETGYYKADLIKFNIGNKTCLEKRSTNGSFNLLETIITVWHELALRLPSPEIIAVSDVDAATLMAGISEIVNQFVSDVDAVLSLEHGISVEYVERVRHTLACRVVASYAEESGCVDLSYEFSEINTLGDYTKSITFQRNTLDWKPLTPTQMTDAVGRELGVVFGHTDGQLAIRSLLTESGAEVHAVACVTSSLGIGKDNQLVYRSKEDMAFFMAHTDECPVIMGLATFESIGKPLKNRRNIVLTSNPDELNKKYESYGTFTIIFVSNLVDAVAHAVKFADEQTPICIIGGESVYNQFLQYTDKCFLTVANIDVDCDRHFPNLTSQHWTTTPVAIDEKLKTDSDKHVRMMFERK